MKSEQQSSKCSQNMSKCRIKVDDGYGNDNSGQSTQKTTILRLLTHHNNNHERSTRHKNKQTTNKKCFCSEKTSISQVLWDDDVSDSVEDKLDVASVSGACCMGINSLPVWVLVELHKLITNEVDASLVVGRPWVCVRVGGSNNNDNYFDYSEVYNWIYYGCCHNLVSPQKGISCFK